MINRFIFGVSIVGVTLFASVMLEVFEGEVNVKNKKKFIEYIRTSNVREKVNSVQHESYRELLKNRLDKTLYDFCVYYEYGKEKLYYERIDAILHDVEVYELGNKINLVF